MYEDLITEWAKAEGFETFAEDHAAVLRNLAKWLERRSNWVANNVINPTTK
jgi:hypothetical protein